MSAGVVARKIHRPDASIVAGLRDADVSPEEEYRE
jgi:hypothetical protein